MEFVIHYGANDSAAKFRVPAKPGVIAGIWDSEAREIYVPELSAVRAGLPYRWRKAFDRSGGTFWFPKSGKAWPAAPYCTLRNARGRHLVTLYAIPAA